jgi:chromosome segregation ATPase
VRNIGGIEETEVDLTPGVNVLTGRNATNRTSLLQAIMAALGSENATLKGDAEEGSVELQIGNDRYSRELVRRNGTVIADGEPYLDDPLLADLFAFLLESNDARRAVERTDDLRELIMRPVDTEAIQEEIEQLSEERRRIDQKLEELSELEDELPGLRDKKADLESRIGEKRAELEEKESEIADLDEDVGETRREKEDLEERLEELRDTRSALEDVRFDIETQRESIEALRDELDEYEDERSELDDSPAGRIEELESEIRRLRNRRQTVESRKNRLESIIQFNEDMLEGTNEDLLDSLGDGDEGSVTDRLVENRVTCWTCGTEVEEDSIRETVETLRGLRAEFIEERDDLQAEIDELQNERQELEETQRQRDRVERGIERTEREIEDREDSIESLEDRREELQDRIEELEDEVQELEQEDYSEVLDLHREANQLEFELGRLQNDLENVEDEIGQTEQRLDEREDLEDRREEVAADLEDRRTRIERIETEAIEQFNSHMEELLDMLGYANLERIWIERSEREVREGRRKVNKTVFDLHVVRRAESGSVYEDTVDHLSESEREVTGLVFALAGYLAHDVYEQVPFMLLDSLEAIDSDRIAALIDYIRDYADYLVVALLPEDASALSDDYTRVTDI